MNNGEKMKIINRKCYMRYNKKTDTYTVVRGTSYVRSVPIKA